MVIFLLNINYFYFSKVYSQDVLGGRNKVDILLSINCKNQSLFENMDKLKLDLLVSTPNDESDFSLLGSTCPVLPENPNSSTLVFDTIYHMDYYFEKHQHLKFEITYRDEKLEPISTTIGRVMGKRNNTEETLIQGLEEVYLVVKVCPIKEEVENLIVRLEISADMSGLPYSDYFVVLSHTWNGGNETKVWKSEEQTGKEFNFAADSLYLYDICQGDLEKEIILDFYRVFYGQMCRVITTLKQIQHLKDYESIPLESIQKGVVIGSCRMKLDMQSSLRFIDYIEKGLQISLVVGLDFTSSNGNPNDAKSLHYIYGYEANNYEQAVRSCGSIVAYYDLDQLFPLYGFGAVISGNCNTNHCFTLNFRENPNVEGIEGIINTYKKCLSRIQLDGPTYFSPLIKNMTNYVKFQTQKALSSSYYILLILTDGQIHDMQQTKDIIVEAAKLPISIIIIGIGEDNFLNMIELDGDKVAIQNKKGEKCERDIVQFVRYNNYRNNSIKLSEEVLQEVPLQVEQYYRLYKNFKGMSLN